MMVTSSLVHALGMGEIEVNTALNEPLEARIKLFSATPEELNNLQVEMASQDAFARVGIDRLPLLRDIGFEVISTGAGAPYIKVTSSSAVKEPFLDFILTVNWASGQMLREYTLLLDPPVFEDSAPAGSIDVATSEPAAQAETAPAIQPRITPRGQTMTSRNDTLWVIARDMRPNTTISVPQMMLGLLKENPEAFGNNNINNLKAGYILRTPDMAIISALSKQEASAEANRQYQDWLADRGASTPGRQQRVSTPVPAAAANDAESAEPAAVSELPSEPRLQLLTPDEEARIRAGTGLGESGESVEVLQQQLAVAIESSEVSRQENNDLRARLEELEQQLQSVQKLLTLKDDTLGALQADIENEEPAADAAVPEEQPEKPAAPAPIAEKPPAAQPTLVDNLLNRALANPVYLAAGGAVVLLLLILLLRRRHDDDNEDFGVVAPINDVDSHNVEHVVDEDAAEDVAAASVDEIAGLMRDEEVSVSDLGDGLGDMHAEESEIDPVAEVDVYLAYRRYEQAEALLKDAIAADPDRHELKLKLLEIYHATKDVNSFEAQAESLYAALGGQEDQMWSKAVEMGRELLPDHPLFLAGETSVSESALDDELNFESLGDSDASAEEMGTLSDNELADSLGFSDTTAEALDDTVKSDSGLDDLELDLDLGEELEKLDEGDDEDKASESEIDLSAELDEFDVSADTDEEADAETEQSSYASRDVESETDGLLDTARKSDELSNVIEMDLPDTEPANEASEDSKDEEDVEIDVVAEEDSTEESDKDKVAKLADEIDGLEEMDFSQMSDESNDYEDIFDSSDDVVGTKLDLAKAYIDMGDQDGARSILGEIVAEGDDTQREQAEQLMQQIS